MPRLPSIAVIGAGLAGLHLAQRLSERAQVTVFEKSRGLGGRMSTRRADPFQFDHGAQYFTARGDAFRKLLAPHMQSGVVARWTPRLTAFGQGAVPVWRAPRYVAVPGMSALAKAMADGLDIRRASRVASVSRQNDRWLIRNEEGADCGVFDWVASTAPAEQTRKLLPEDFGPMDRLHTARMLGCYSLMIGLPEAPQTGWDAAVVHGGPLAWIALNHSKPGRGDAASVLCQSSNRWAERHMEDDQEKVRDRLCAVFREVTGLDMSDAMYVSLHRWRFALVETAAGASFLLDPSARLAAAGDWCGEGRVQSAFDSAEALANAIGDMMR